MSYLVPREIPSDCTRCRWGMCNYPTVYCRLMHKGSDMLMAIKSRPDWCPLIEVKTPHGKLIDVNKIEYENWYLEETGEIYKIVGKDDIDEMLAVVEAEGEMK